MSDLRELQYVFTDNVKEMYSYSRKNNIYKTQVQYLLRKVKSMNERLMFFHFV